ncbi:MAG: phosphodiester glycosidase family protein [Lachnospiraceae bacterium]|nr:phosphodiester glycosidase family protein [Lachnospiraceae bacterium]
MSVQKHRKNLWPWIFGILLTGYALFTLLNTFLIPHDVVTWAEIEAVEPEFSAAEYATEQEIEGEVTEDSYVSDEISIRITTLNRYNTWIYVADIILSDPSYLRTGLAQGAFGRNLTEKTSTIAEDCGAILAINGDFYGFRDTGYVMRNGYLYRTSLQDSWYNEDLVIYEDGRMEIVDERDSEAEILAEAGAQHIFSFGPGLVKDYELAVDEETEVDASMTSNPRTAIGIIEPLHYVFTVSDGRQAESEGLTLYELAEVMQELGCQTAYNLDGGGSSTMWFMGNVVNNPTSGTTAGERGVSDIVYIGK